MDPRLREDDGTISRKCELFSSGMTPATHSRYLFRHRSMLVSLHETCTPSFPVRPARVLWTGTARTCGGHTGSSHERTCESGLHRQGVALDDTGRGARLDVDLHARPHARHGLVF